MIILSFEVCRGWRAVFAIRMAEWMLAIKKQSVLPRNSREKEAGWFTPDYGGAGHAGLACICFCTPYEDERL